MNRTLPRVPGCGLATLVVAVVCGGLPTALHAQRMNLSDASAEPVFVESASIATEITGRIAVTTFDLVFRNPNRRNLEGTFEFPLLEGQSVVHFALDVGGRLRDAVPVEKEKTRVVFEEVQRRRVDPGLIEKTAGNNYRARIFPLPAGGTRHIVIAYQEDIARGTGAPTYRLPLDFPGRLPRFNFTADVFTGSAQAPKAGTTLDLELPAWRDARRLEIDRRDFIAQGVLEVALPELDHPGVITERRGEREYFYAELPVNGDAAARAEPKKIGLLWDSSGSGRARDHERELALLEAWFQDVREVEVRVFELRDTVTDAGTFVVRDGDWTELRHQLDFTTYDGATSIDGLADDPSIDEWILFSDGLFNYGVTLGWQRLPLRAPVHTVVASPRADPTFLRGVALRQAGEFADLMTDEPKIAAARLRERSLRVLGIEARPEAVAQVFPEVGTPVTTGALVVTGLLRQPRATVRVLIGHGRDDAQAFDLELRSGENAGHLAARGWATAKIDALAINFAANREDIRRTSREFGIVTADTSLLVLETVQDYARFDITPPPELRQEWERQVRMVADNRAKERDTHLDRVARAWAERVAWWETKFPRPGGWRRYQDTGQVDRDVRRRESILFGQAAPSPAPMRTRGGGVESDDAMPADNETTVLSPFAVSADRLESYSSAETLAGSRVRSEWRDPAEPEEVTFPDGFDPDRPAPRSRGTISGALVGGIGNGESPAEADRLELEKSRAQAARFKAAIDEELAVANGFRVSETDLAETEARVGALEDRLRVLQEERQASLSRRVPLNAPSSNRIQAAQQEISRLEAELAELRGQSVAASGARFRDTANGRTRSVPARLGGKWHDPWSEDGGYLDRLRRSDAKDRYAIYLEERPDHARQPGFFLDVAEFLFAHGDCALGQRVLSNLAELALEDAGLLRVLGHRLVQADRADLARPVFAHVLEIRSEEPQSRRDLALVCAQLGEAQRAVDLLWEVVAQPWHSRFPGIELIALGELNAIAAAHPDQVALDAVDRRLRQNLACGLRVVLTWDSDNCDIDLWVDDPSGETCLYNHPMTAQGGRISNDFTQGYGPEEFLLRAPQPGEYRVRINYYGDRRQTALGPVTAQVRMITGFGTPEEKEEQFTVRLSNRQETRELGRIQVKR